MKSVKIGELRSRLSQHLRDVQRGQTVTVLDRDTPIARVVPIDSEDEVTITLPAPSAPPFGKIKLPAVPQVQIDVVEILLADRRNRG